VGLAALWSLDRMTGDGNDCATSARPGV